MRVAVWSLPRFDISRSVSKNFTAKCPETTMSVFCTIAGHRSACHEQLINRLRVNIFLCIHTGEQCWYVENFPWYHPYIWTIFHISTYYTTKHGKTVAHFSTYWIYSLIWRKMASFRSQRTSLYWKIFFFSMCTHCDTKKRHLTGSNPMKCCLFLTPNSLPLFILRFRLISL